MIWRQEDRSHRKELQLGKYNSVQYYYTIITPKASTKSTRFHQLPFHLWDITIVCISCVCLCECSCVCESMRTNQVQCQ